METAMNQSNILDFYTFEKTLGKGQFGLVKLAVHKKTGKKVAIKQVKKKNMSHIEVFQQRREIEVLKMCQHPNIITLIDLFENVDYYFIVLEYMGGSDLFDYLSAREFNLGENRVREISYQLALGIKYLHSYGIVHRDLKLENVMMSDTTDQSIPKLVDFGLAKMIGPQEKADEPFGTLGYVAPEILEKKPYSL
jgi:serine/threonine protein kinase